MVDFHSHFLPGMDDGAESVDIGLDMLRESFRQGVRLICATPHFYADEEDPAGFLKRRDEAYKELREAMGDGGDFPKILLGAEIQYFPGMSVADELRSLCLQGSPFLLVEPPMLPWSELMLDEIEQCGAALRCVPVIAHIDRYMRLLDDPTLFDRVKGRRILSQVNASFFLYRQSRDFALDSLRDGRFHMIGSDCHNMYDRWPNMGDASVLIRTAGLGGDLEKMNRRLYRALTPE